MTTYKELNVISLVDTILSGKELLDQPRALLLLRMCQFTMQLAPDLTEKYWQMLSPVEKKIPSDTQADLNELRTSMEESLPSSAKGFTAEMLSEIQEIIKLAESEKMKQQLLDCEQKLKKHFMLVGKGVVWTALAETWVLLDRKYALQLLKNISGGSQENFIIKWNKTNALSEEEWTVLGSAVGTGRTERSVIKILEDEKQALNLPKQILSQAAANILRSMQQYAVPINMVELAKTFRKYTRLILLHATNQPGEVISGLVEELYLNFAKAGWLDQAWLERFNMISLVLGISSQLKSAGIDLFTSEFIDRLASKTPPYLVNFLWAEWAGTTCSTEGTEQAYADLMKKTGNDQTAEAWFLVALVKRGLGARAMEMAAKSANTQALLPRLRRCWICIYPDTAKTKISPADMTGDPIGEFLAQGGVKERVAYLKSVTNEGKTAVPGAMWAGAGTEEEPEGLRGFWKSLSAHKKTNDEIIVEYVTRNPLYSSYRRDTKKEEQFKEALRVNGYGEYRYQDMDNALLAALVAWGDQEPEQVHSVLQAMWHAIQPDDNILMLDWLRNAILSRCVNVFSADASVLIQDYLEWHKRELVQKGRQWQFGKQIITLRYPPTSMLQFCIVAASAVSVISAARKDQIIITGLQKFETNPALVESAAQIYNSGKPLLALESPVNLKPDLQAAWQSGIVKNALTDILQALLVRYAEEAKKK